MSDLCQLRSFLHHQSKPFSGYVRAWRASEDEFSLSPLVSQALVSGHIRELLPPFLKKHICLTFMIQMFLCLHAYNFSFMFCPRDNFYEWQGKYLHPQVIFVMLVGSLSLFLSFILPSIQRNFGPRLPLLTCVYSPVINTWNPQLIHAPIAYTSNSYEFMGQNSPKMRLI